MRLILFFTSLLFILSSCFKDEASNEYSKVAGSWLIKEVVIDIYDSIGNPSSQTTYADRGYYMLNYNEGGLALNTFAYSIKNDEPDFNAASEIVYVLSLCNSWDVAVNASHLNFGYKDEATGYNKLVIGLTVSKINGKNMHWEKIDRNPNGTLARKELFKLKRSN